MDLAFGVSAAVGESLDIEECMGRKALAKVTNIEKNDKTYDRITSLLPAPSREYSRPMSTSWTYRC